MGFPGAKLGLGKDGYSFSVSYTEKHAALVTYGKPVTTVHESASATISGTVVKAKQISGTISVAAAGCGLKTSTYKAKPITAWPRPLDERVGARPRVPRPQNWAWSSSADGTTTGPSGGYVNRIGLPNGSCTAQSVP